MYTTSITINLVISPDSPEPLRNAVANLLALITPEDIKDSRTPHPLSQVWLTKAEIAKFAEATGQNKGIAKMSTGPIQQALLYEQSEKNGGGGWDFAAPLPDIFRVNYKLTRYVRADTFVAIIRSDEARLALKSDSRGMGPSLESMGILLADWLESTYGELNV